MRSPPMGASSSIAPGKFAFPRDTLMLFTGTLDVWKSRQRAGRPKIDRELRDLIRRMSRENPKWGASRIHGELLMLGLEVAQSTVSKYMVQGGSPSQGWKDILPE